VGGALGNLEKNNEQMLAITKKRRKKLIAEEIDRETSKMRL
jgi:hypothetical protein